MFQMCTTAPALTSVKV